MLTAKHIQAVPVGLCNCCLRY